MRRLFIMIALACLTSSCATTQFQAHVDGQIAADAQRAAREKAAPVAEGFYLELDEYWFGGDAFDLAAPNVEPASLDEYVTYKPQYAVTLQMIAADLTTDFGLSIHVSTDAIESSSRATFDAVASLQAENSVANIQDQSSVDSLDSGATFRIQHEGPLRNLLDAIAARTNNSWLYRDGRINLFHFDTRTYRVHAFAGNSQFTATISNQAEGGSSESGGGGGGEGGEGGGVETTQSNGQTTTVTTDLDILAGTLDTIEAMLSEGGNVSLAESTGIVTITDVPAIHDRVDAYIDQLNSQITQQVAIDVSVYSVESNHSEGYGIDWTLVYESLNGQYGSTATAFGPEVIGANSLALTVIDPTYNYAGSSIFLDALAEQADISTVTSSTTMTLSNNAVPVQIGEQTSYVSSVQDTLVSDAGSQRSINLSSITTGFSMNLLPVVLDDKELLLQVQLSLSDLQLRQIEESGIRLESPTISSQQFLQRVRLNSGQTLVMTGFEQDALDTSRRGVGKPDFILAGGGRNASKSRRMLVIMLTPRVMA